MPIDFFLFRIWLKKITCTLSLKFGLADERSLSNTCVADKTRRISKKQKKLTSSLLINKKRERESVCYRARGGVWVAAEVMLAKNNLKIEPRWRSCQECDVLREIEWGLVEGSGMEIGKKIRKLGFVTKMVETGCFVSKMLRNGRFCPKMAVFPKRRAKTSFFKFPTLEFNFNNSRVQLPR